MTSDDEVELDESDRGDRDAEVEAALSLVAGFWQATAPTPPPFNEIQPTSDAFVAEVSPGDQESADV